MTAGFELSQVACAVTSCVLPSERTAVAVSCVIAPISGIEPEILIAVTPGVGVGATGIEPSQAGRVSLPHAFNEPTRQPAATIHWTKLTNR